ncbi:MAG: NAD(P)-dependent oxidoreductase [Candidatus Micrarchaeota archaeon]
MRIVVADEMNPNVLRELREIVSLTQGGYVHYLLDKSDESPAVRLERELVAAEVLIVRSETKLVKNTLAELTHPNLVLVARAGIGLDNINVPLAQQMGLTIANTPDAHIFNVSEHTIALILALSKDLRSAVNHADNGKWAKKQLKPVELYDKTLGIVGFGNIGQEVAKRLHYAFGMNVLFYDALPKESDFATPVPLADLFARSDVISLHLPSLESTKNIVNETLLRLLKEGVILANTGRGDTVDENALWEIIRARPKMRVGLDVIATEETKDRPAVLPPTDIITMSRFLFTPHVASATDEANERCGFAIANFLREKSGLDTKWHGRKDLMASVVGGSQKDLIQTRLRRVPATMRV